MMIILFALIFFIAIFAGVCLMSVVAPQRGDLPTCFRISVILAIAYFVVGFFGFPNFIASILLIYFNIKEFDMDPLPAFLATALFAVGSSVVILSISVLIK